MKVLPILILCGAAGMAGAQLNPEADILHAYGHLQNDSPYEFSMTGSQTQNGTTRTFASNLYWSYSSSSSPFPQVELDDYDTTSGSMVLLRRFVGDGRTLFFYDLQKRRVMASLYSYYGANAPTNVAPPVDGYPPILLAQLYAETRGPSSQLVRLMREINPGTDPVSYPSHYESWAPGYAPSVPPTSPPTPDPLVPTRQYSSGGSVEWVVYGLSNPKPNRSVAFKLYNVNPDPTGVPDYTLEEIDFADAGPDRFLNWTMTVTDPATIGAGIFQPWPASATAGWQSVPPPKG